MSMYRSPKILAAAKDAPVCFGCQATNVGQVKAGDRFYRLLVLELIPDKKNPKARCLCDCGKVITPQRGALKSGKAKSCGCLRMELFSAAQAGRPKMDEAEKKRRQAVVIDRWHKANPERTRAASRKFYRLNKPKVKTYHHARRAIIRGAKGTVSPGIEERLMLLQKGRCACCKKPFNNVKHHIDHVIALSRGGMNDDSNLQLLCATCNLQKGAKHPVEFMQLKGFLL